MNGSNQFIEVTGYIQKEETLTPVGDNIVTNTSVLESLHPFPGYYGDNHPDKSQPRSIFILLNEHYSFEEIARKTKRIKQRFQYDFNASEGTIFISPYEYNCLRIKYLQSFTNLPELQKEYMSEHIKFHKAKDIRQKAIIRLNKVFRIYESNGGIYKDADDPYKCYLEIPEKLPWENFVRITHNIKNNLVDNMFDAALGVLYRSQELVDVIRIYDRDKDDLKMQKLKRMYLEEISRLYK